MGEFEFIQADLRALQNPAKAKILARFFKTGKGEYGEGDVFLGLSMPDMRRIVKTHWKAADLEDAERLLANEVHEYRTVGVLVLAERYAKAKEERGRQAIYEFYLAHRTRIDNWDLVDISAPNVVGDWLLERESRSGRSEWEQILPALARSKNWWERRIAIISTFAFIRAGRFEPTINIATQLVGDEHDLIHKAVGWMLREMGKRGGERELRAFLDRHGAKMPRTMLRYAIEKMNARERARYLAMGAGRPRSADRVKKPAKNHLSRVKPRPE